MSEEKDQEKGRRRDRRRDRARSTARKARGQTAGIFDGLEDVFYVAVAAALALAGVALFIDAIVVFFSHLKDQPFAKNILDLLDEMLLVFIIIELISTVRAVIAENVLRMEPFLVVGIVAAIREVLIVSAEAEDLVGKPEFVDAMWQSGVLGGVVLLLGLTIFLLRRTTQAEPTPAHEQGDEEARRSESE